MSKAVLISVQPKWCELIASGKKTVEVRKDKPNLAVPFKCYIYQTKGRWVYDIYSKISDWKGKVIGEFICRRIDEYTLYDLTEESAWRERRSDLLLRSCLTWNELFAYMGKDKSFCKVWHISDLVIYDQPKELSEFEKPHDYIYQSYRKRNSFFKGITRPPQSWCYVEEQTAQA